MEICKNFESYMFACGGNCNIVVEAESKIKAIEKFEYDFNMRFNGDWKVFKITTRVDVEGNYLRY